MIVLLQLICCTTLGSWNGLCYFRSLTSFRCALLQFQCPPCILTPSNIQISTLGGRGSGQWLPIGQAIQLANSWQFLCRLLVNATLHKLKLLHIHLTHRKDKRESSYNKVKGGDRREKPGRTSLPCKDSPVDHPKAGQDGQMERESSSSATTVITKVA